MSMHPIKLSVPPNILARIDAEIEVGNFGSRGELALYAVRYYLDHVEDVKSGIQFDPKK